MKIGILTGRDYKNNKLIEGSAVIRADYLIRYWPEAELYREGADYGVVIFQKASAFEVARKFMGIKILDSCDVHTGIEEFAKVCHAVVVPTHQLAERYAGHPMVRVIPDRHDLLAFTRKKHHQGPVRWVCWFGYSFNWAVLSDPRDRSWLDVIKHYNLRLKIISNMHYPLADVSVLWDWRTAFDELLSVDVVLNPIVTRYKSDNKSVTAWLLNIPVARTIDELEAYIHGKDRNVTIDASCYDVRKSVEQYKQLIAEIEANVSIRDGSAATV